MATEKITLLQGYPLIDNAWEPVYDVLYDGTLQSATTTRLVYSDGEGSKVVFTGTFTLAGGNVTGGTMTGFTAYTGPTATLKGSGFDVAAADLLDAFAEAENNDEFDPFWALVWEIPLVQTGSAGGDWLGGNGLNGKLLGRGGSDELWGSEGNEVMKGGPGDDFLFGGLGFDRLTGGSGRDVFVFNNFEDVDKVTDFTPKHDTMVLSGMFGATLGLGHVSENEFHIGKAAKTADHHLIYSKGSGLLYYDIDGKGGATMMPLADLGRNLDLKAKNFFVTDGYDIA